MKIFAAISLLLCLALAPLSQASDVGVGVNIQVGNPPVAPVYVNSPVVIAAPPVFLLPPQLGFYAAVGVPYDLFFFGNYYYLYSNGGWYRAPYYNGPWLVVPYKSLPPGLRKHKFEKIRYYRDVEYRHYHGNEAHYRGRHFRPEKAWKEHHKGEPQRSKEGKNVGKGKHGGDHGHGHGGKHGGQGKGHGKGHKD